MNQTYKRLLALCVIFTSGLIAGGCSHEAGGIILTSQKNHQKFDQGFDEAYYSTNARGDLEIVLLDHAMAQHLAGQTPQHNLRQVLELRVLWDPARETKSSDAADCNATVRWYIFDEQSHGVLEYGGTGFVTTEQLGDLAEVRIRNAQVRPIRVSAGLMDAVGPSKIEGSVFAHLNQQTVDQITAEISAFTASPSSSPSH